MAWLTALTSILGTVTAPVANAFGKWQDRRAQVSAAKHEATLERIKSMRGDWKDEVVLIVVLYPIVSMFIPIDVIQENTFEAFKNLSQLPEWYVGLYAGICMAVFGIQAIPKLRK